MNERTRSYLRGRFGDYYRRHEPSVTPTPGCPNIPPALTRREWAHIPFTTSSGTTMVRHEAIHERDQLGSYLERIKPRHIYHSAATYDDPAASTMGSKGWRGADLVFDLDADHLPGVSPEDDDMPTMLSACREATVELVELLADDFGFEELSVVFSGNRGYHVHVRDDGVAALDRSARREVVEYVRGESLSVDSLVSATTVAGRGGTTTKREFHTDSGWGKRVVDRLVDYLGPLRERTREETIAELEELPGIGPTRAEHVSRTIESRWSDIQRGNLDLHPDFVRFVRTFVEEDVTGSGPAIDEPVTTDVHRLIRLPGSLHGASGLIVQPLDRDELAEYEPLREAVVPMFDQVHIRVEVTAPATVAVGGESRRFDAGVHEVPEYLGIYLMARGHAEKVKE